MASSMNDPRYRHLFLPVENTKFNNPVLFSPFSRIIVSHDTSIESSGPHSSVHYRQMNTEVPSRANEPQNYSSTHRATTINNMKFVFRAFGSRAIETRHSWLYVLAICFLALTGPNSKSLFLLDRLKFRHYSYCTRLVIDIKLKVC